MPFAGKAAGRNLKFSDIVFFDRSGYLTLRFLKLIFRHKTFTEPAEVAPKHEFLNVSNLLIFLVLNYFVSVF